MKILGVILIMLFAVAIAQAANQPLCDEISLDPLARGYSSMTPEQVAADINTAYRTRFLTQVEGAALFEGISGADWVALSEGNRDRVLMILGLGSLDPQGNVRTLLISIFGAGSQTISNMAAIATETVSRATELNLGLVRTGNVQECNP